MRIAAIDIGTNTVLLLIADVDTRGEIHPIVHEQRLPRLGKDVDQNGIIHISAFDRIAWILNEYKNISTQFKTERLVACATSAVRDAANRDEFISHLITSTGISIEVLSGKDEALWTYRGAISGFTEIGNDAVVLDIGGGSTEISYQHYGNELKHHSLQIGCVRLTERYFHHNPPIPEELTSAIDSIHRGFQTIPKDSLIHRTLIGVAGTVTTLVCLELGLSDFDVSRVNGYRLRRERVGFWLRKLLSMTSEEIQALSNTTEGRADILGAGVLILCEFMKRFHFDSIVVSERGLRYGLVLKEWNRVK